MIPKTGEYIDQCGDVWFCVARPNAGWMVCTGDGKYTVAGFDTFSRWGWTRRESDKDLPTADDVRGILPVSSGK